MIRVKPEIENQPACPKCFRKATVKEIMMPAFFTMTNCYCKNCEFEFYETLPVGHSIIDTLIIGKADGKFYGSNAKKTWLSDAVVKALVSEKREPVQIKKHIYAKYDDVIILNTLDFLYGHVLLKLYNSSYHLEHHKNLGLIVIVPTSFEWLVPKGCAEVWVVDLKLSELAYFHSSIQSFLRKEFERFTSIYLSKAYSHPELTSIDIAQFTCCKPFDLETFSHVPPTFTFILREDRWWFGGYIDYWFYRFCRKLGALKMGSRVLSMRQNQLVRRTITRIRKKLPDAVFFIVGLGTTGNFSGHAQDERKNSISELVERDWCKIYARSQVVIGVHGSNMLLPTAHAAGCVEILPEDRYGNIVQDISVRYADRKQQYFYRFADQYSRSKIIARKAISIVENFEVFNQNMCCNIYSTESVTEVIHSQDDIYAIH